MRIAVIDSYYTDFLKTVKFDPEMSYYDMELKRLLGKKFGTFDAYSRNLRTLGHQTIDICGNHAALQSLWAREHGMTGGGSCQAIALEQIEAFKPDCIFMQDLGFFDEATLEMLAGRYLLAGQISCAMPPASIVSKYRILFTSFPFYVPRLEALGVRAIYLPLAFDVDLLEDIERMAPDERDIEISFVGGIGSHWRAGTDVLEAVAAAFGRRFWWFGYGIDNLPAESALRACWRGPAYGMEMYNIYRRSKIVLNRHGEVAEGFSNNLRMYEAAGCGAMLLTEQSANLDGIFKQTECAHYCKHESISNAIEFHLEDSPIHYDRIALNGKVRTLRDHTYAQRMPIVSEALQEALCLK